jgi:hypothetical protein
MQCFIQPFLNAYYVAVHKASDLVWEENFQLLLKPHLYCILNFIISGKFHPWKANFSGPDIW